MSAVLTFAAFWLGVPFAFGVLAIALGKVRQWNWVLAWFDVWVGVYWDRRRRRLYVLPLPCCGYWLDLGRPRTGRERIEVTIKADGRPFARGTTRALAALASFAKDHGMTPAEVLSLDRRMRERFHVELHLEEWDQ